MKRLLPRKNRRGFESRLRRRKRSSKFLNRGLLRRQRQRPKESNKSRKLNAPGKSRKSLKMQGSNRRELLLRRLKRLNAPESRPKLRRLVRLRQLLSLKVQESKSVLGSMKKKNSV